MSVGFVQYNSGSTHASFQAVDSPQFTGSITQTIGGKSFLVGGPNVTITSGTVTDQITISVAAVAGQGDPNATYVVLATSASLNNERVLNVSGTSGLTLSDTGPGGNASLSINNAIVATVSGTTFTGAVTASAGILAAGITSSNGASVTAGGLNVANSTNAVTTISTPMTASLGIRVTGITHPGVQAFRLSGSHTQTFNGSSSFIHRPGIIVTSGAFGGVGSDEQVAFGINDVFVATVSGTTFTGAVTASAGILATGVTSSLGIRVTAGGVSVVGTQGSVSASLGFFVPNTAGAKIESQAPITGSAGLIITGVAGISGTHTQTATGKSAFVGSPGITISSGSAAQDDQVIFLINNNAVATVSGTRFTGPVTASSGLLVNSPQGITGTITRNSAGLSYIVAGTGVQVTSGTAADQIVITALGSGDVNPSYVVLATTASLNNERVLNVSGTSGLTLSDTGPNGNASLSINNAIVATVSGTNFSGPITASSGLLVSSPQGMTGAITRNAAGTSYIAATGQLVTVSSASSTQISLDLNVPAGRIVGTTFTGTLPGALNPTEAWSILDATRSLGFQVTNYTTPSGAPLTNSNFDAAFRATCRAAVSGGGGTVVIPGGEWLVTSDGDLDPITWSSSPVTIRGAGMIATRLIVPSNYTGSVISFRAHNLGLPDTYQSGGGVEDLMISSQTITPKGTCIRFEKNYQFTVRNVWCSNFLGVGARGLYNSGLGFEPLIIGLHLDNVILTAWIGLDLNSINSSYAYNLRLEGCGHRSAVFSGGCGLKVFGGITEAISNTSASACHVEFVPGAGGALGPGGRPNFIWKGGYAEQSNTYTGSIFKLNDYVSGGVASQVFSGLVELEDWEMHTGTEITFLSATYASVALRNIFSNVYPAARLDNCVSVETWGIAEGVDGALIMDATSRRNHNKQGPGIYQAGTLVSAPVISSSLGFRLPFHAPNSHPSASVTPSGTLVANTFTNEISYKRDRTLDSWAPIAERPFDIDLDLGPFLGEYWDPSRTDLVQTATSYLPGTSVAITFVTGAFSGTVLTSSATRPSLETDVNLGGNKVIKFNKTGSTNLSFQGSSPFIASDTTGPWIIGVISHDEEAVSSDGVWCVISGTNGQIIDGYFTLNTPGLDTVSWLTGLPSLIFTNNNNMTGSNGFVTEFGFGQPPASTQSATAWFNGELAYPGYNPTNSNGVQKVWLGSNSAGQYVSARVAFFMILKKYPGDVLMWKLRQYLAERFNLPIVKHQAPAVKSPYLTTFKTTGAPADMLTVYDFVEVTMNGQKVYLPVFK